MTIDLKTPAEILAEGLNERIVPAWRKVFPLNPEPYFEVIQGIKYEKIVRRERGGSRAGSAFAFVERASGAVYKPASWARPSSKPKFANVNDALAEAEAYGARAMTGGFLYADAESLR